MCCYSPSTIGISTSIHVCTGGGESILMLGNIFEHFAEDIHITQYTVHYIMCNVHIKGSRFSQIRNRLIAAVAFGFLRLISMGIVLYFKSFLKNYICT